MPMLWKMRLPGELRRVERDARRNAQRRRTEPERRATTRRATGAGSERVNRAPHTDWSHQRRQRAVRVVGRRGGRPRRHGHFLQPPPRVCGSARTTQNDAQRTRSGASSDASLLVNGDDGVASDAMTGGSGLSSGVDADCYDKIATIRRRSDDAHS